MDLTIMRIKRDADILPPEVGLVETLQIVFYKNLFEPIIPHLPKPIRGGWGAQPPLIGLLDAAPICPRLEKAGNSMVIDK